jgi:crotonobetainyl-CoA:carnitine CoA-transferase CaiB-like acyl-CoA transferase
MENIGVFKDLKIIEIATVLAAPQVGQFFAELGAMVIKIENPKTKGDVTRKWLLNGETSEPSAYFVAANLGKYSVSIDLQKHEGQKIVLELLKNADILILNLKPGDAHKLGLNEDKLLKLNPRLIIGEITGYGKDSPRTGYDAVIQAEAGFMFLNREPNELPQKMPVALMDLVASHQLKEALLIALYERTFTDKGKKVSVSLIQAGIASLANQGTAWLVSHLNPQPMGSEHPSIFPYGAIFLTIDNQYVMLAVGNDKEFALLCKSLSLENLISDERFCTNALRVQNRKELKAIIAEKILQKSQNEWIGIWNELKIPCAPVNDIPTVFSLDYSKDLIFDDNHGNQALKTVAFKGIETNHCLMKAPFYAEHTKKILQEVLHLEEEVIEKLRLDGVIEF